MNRYSSRPHGFSLFFLLQIFTSVAFAQMPALSPLPGTGQLPSPADPNKFTFVLAGDNRPAKSSCPQPPEPGMIFEAVKALNPPAAFVLWTGDTISGKQPDATQLKKEYHKFLELAAQAGVPVFNAPGNHELDDSNNVPSQAMKGYYRDNMAGTYGAFSYGNSRFIALDSENEPAASKKSKELTTAEGEAKSEAPGSITTKQLGLLKEDLAADTKTGHVFIFMHHPVFPYDAKDGLDQASVTALQDLFAQYSVSYVVSGHEHMYYNSLGSKTTMTPPPSRTDPLPPPLPMAPPFYLVSGGGGAPLKNTPAGSFFHYLVFKVDGDKVSPTLVQIGSCGPCPGKDKPNKCDPCAKQEKCSSLNQLH
jgi:hypothetical protein